MHEQAFFTLGEASKATGKSKATLSNAVKSGRLSVHEKTDRGYRIAASELFRVFPPNRSSDAHAEQDRTPWLNSLNGLESSFERENELLREERERERQLLQATIDDLRRRLDAADEERRRLTMLLTDQRAPQDKAPSRGGYWRGLWSGLLGRR